MCKLTKDSKSVFLKCIILSTLLLTGCVSEQKVEDIKASEIVHVESKALLEDKTKSESNTVSIDLFYQSNAALRLEVSAVLGIQLGSIVMLPNQLSYALHQQKVFVTGPLISKTLKPLFKQDLDPKIIWSLVFDKDLSIYGFKCKKSEQQLDCIGLENGIQTVVTKENKSNGLKKMTIENSLFKFVWIYKSIKKHNVSYNETFVLKKPEEYRLITIK